MTADATTIVLLFRHPQTTWNAESRYQGVLNPPLSATGEHQLQQTAAIVEPDSFSLVYTSPLDRARRLAEAIAAKAGVPLTVDDRLLEIGLGEWQGLHRDEIARRFPHLFAAWRTRPDTVHIPGGELLADVGRRTASFLADVFRDHLGSRVAVVTHDVVVKMAVMQALGLPLGHLHRFALDNASISILAGMAAPGRLQTLNVTAHLTGSALEL